MARTLVIAVWLLAAVTGAPGQSPADKPLPVSAQLAPGKPLRLTHPGLIFVASFSPDGKRLASASNDGTLRLWDWTNQRELWKGTTDGVWVTTLSLTGDGAFLVPGGGRVSRLWNVTTGAEARPALPVYHTTATLSPDGNTVVLAYEGWVQGFDRQSGKKVYQFTNSCGRPTGLVFTADGKQLIASGIPYVSHAVPEGGRGQRPIVGDGLLRVWDVASQKLVRQLKVAPTGVEQVMLAGPGECLTVSAAGPGMLPQTVAVWDLASGEKKRSFGFPRVGRDCYRVAVSPDGALWAWAMTPPLETRDATIHLYDAVGRRALATLSGHRWVVSNLAFSPTGEHLVSTSNEEILIWDLSTFTKRD